MSKSPPLPLENSSEKPIASPVDPTFVHARTHAPIRATVEMAPGFFALDLGLYIPADDALVFSDLQLGIEEHHNNQGVYIPRFNFREVKQHLQRMFIFRPRISHIILNGDIKHGFGKAGNQEWREVIDLLELLSQHSDRITIVKGNHDIALEPLARFAKVKMNQTGLFLPHSQTYVCHGHEIPVNADITRAKTIVIGHDHPAVTLADGATRQKYKCFLVGTWEKKRLVVLPSFNFAHPGSDPREGSLSPFLKPQRLDHFRTWMVEDEVYDFGLLGEL